MKQKVTDIIIASVIAFLLFMCVNGLVRAIFSEIESAFLKSILLNVVNSLIFGICLVYTAKIRKSRGEGEVFADYKDKSYVSIFHDLKLVAKNEKQILIIIAAIILFCFAINTIEQLFFAPNTISLITILFLPMHLIKSIIKTPFVEYLIGFIFTGAGYLIVLGIYRLKTYTAWKKNKL